MHKRTILLFIGFIIILTGLLAAAPYVAAQDPQPTPSDNDVNRVARQLYCPVCENIPLDVCPTQACHDWRELIRQKLAAGWTDEQIKDYFATNYGDRVLAAPPARGLNWLVYILPILAIPVGGFIVWRVITSAQRTRATSAQPGTSTALPGPASGSSDDDRYLRELEEELKKNR